MQDKITIDGIEYTKTSPSGPWTVYIIESGWTICGDKETRDDSSITVHNAHCIRKYGDGIGVTAIADKRGLVTDSFKSNVTVPIGKVLFSFSMPEDWSL